jgi:hypothetical protein
MLISLRTSQTLPRTLLVFAQLELPACVSSPSVIARKHKNYHQEKPVPTGRTSLMRFAVPKKSWESKYRFHCMAEFVRSRYSACLLDTTPPKRVPVQLGATGTRLLYSARLTGCKLKVQAYKSRLEVQFSVVKARPVPKNSRQSRLTQKLSHTPSSSSPWRARELLDNFKKRRFHIPLIFE